MNLLGSQVVTERPRVLSIVGMLRRKLGALLGEFAGKGNPNYHGKSSYGPSSCSALNYFKVIMMYVTPCIWDNTEFILSSVMGLGCQAGKFTHFIHYNTFD